jgi:hypothetical protein
MNVWLCLLVLSLASAELMQCIYDFTQIVNKRISPIAYDTYSTMGLYSGFKKNDLGDYANCAKQDYAEYLIIEASFAPPIIFSLCGSKNCTEDDYRIIFSSTIKSTVLDYNTIYMAEEQIKHHMSTISNFQTEFKEFINYSSVDNYQHLIRPLAQRTFIKSLTNSIRIRILALQLRYISHRII